MPVRLVGVVSAGVRGVVSVGAIRLRPLGGFLDCFLAFLLAGFMARHGRWDVGGLGVCPRFTRWL